jgi:hypothetical protein
MEGGKDFAEAEIEAVSGGGEITEGDLEPVEGIGLLNIWTQ